MQNIAWHIGCSGFHYKEWKGVFYPQGLPQTKWFEYYTRHFNTLELNVTFYRFPKVSSLQEWYNKSPDSFLFSAKVPKFISHFRQFSNTRRMLNDFYSIAKEGLKEKLGAVLFQSPPQMQYSEEKLNEIIDQVNDSFVNVIEFRHISWWQPKVYKKLKKHNIIFCGHSYPHLPEDVVVNKEICYYRFHGVPKLYKSAYTNKFLDSIIKGIKTSAARKCFLYFNNTWGIAAIKNALHTQRIINKI
ncbi:MAG: DUF72 domain-containing protein [Chitinophagaceae bacterium]|nr:DUF72 domain-containing protein [Chitinophagaceae bacterium]